MPIRHAALLSLLLAALPAAAAESKESIAAKFQALRSAHFHQKQQTDSAKHREIGELYARYLGAHGIETRLEAVTAIRGDAKFQYYLVRVLSVPPDPALDWLRGAAESSAKAGYLFGFSTALVGRTGVGFYNYTSDSVELRPEFRATNPRLDWLTAADEDMVSTVAHESLHAEQNRAARKGVLYKDDLLYIVFRTNEPGHLRFTGSSFDTYSASHASCEYAAYLLEMRSMLGHLKKTLEGHSREPSEKSREKARWLGSIVTASSAKLGEMLATDESLLAHMLDDGIESLALTPEAANFPTDVELLLTRIGTKTKNVRYAAAHYDGRRTYVEFDSGQLRTALRAQGFKGASGPPGTAWLPPLRALLKQQREQMRRMNREGKALSDEAEKLLKTL